MKCKQRLHILLLFLLTAMASMAQSTMTDSQIQDYIAKEVAKGTERSTIGSSLQQINASSACDIELGLKWKW